MTPVNEKSTSYVSVSFRDKAGALAVPTAITYRIDNLSDGAQIKPWTAITPASAVEVRIAPAENILLDPAKNEETRRLTFVATYSPDASDQLATEHDYVLRRIRFLSVAFLLAGTILLADAGEILLGNDNLVLV